MLAMCRSKYVAQYCMCVVKLITLKTPTNVLEFYKELVINYYSIQHVLMY